jgi:hypothetical protein
VETSHRCELTPLTGPDVARCGASPDITLRSSSAPESSGTTSTGPKAPVLSPTPRMPEVVASSCSSP